MDRYLFYMYLEYLKENKLTSWPKLLKHPKVVILLMIAIVASGIFSVAISFVDISRYLSLAAVGAEFLFCVFLYIYTENYMITYSKKRINEYKDYCKKIKNWLNSCNIKNEEKINILLERVNVSMKELEIIDQKSQERTEKWLQTLIVPIVLAIITTILSSNSGAKEMISGILTVIILFISIYSIYVAVSKLASFPNKRMYQQLKCFASDLQGVLDTQFSNSIFK